MNSNYFRFVYLFILLGYLTALNGLQPDFPEPTLTVFIPMRDGTELPTDIYLPSANGRNLPCILLRSPAGRRENFFLSITELAKDGYAIAIQETRNVLDSEGKTLPFISDGWGKLQDGYDTVEWLANSPYTNGKIGTWGASALGITQLLMAPSQPPHLVCPIHFSSRSQPLPSRPFPGRKAAQASSRKLAGPLCTGYRGPRIRKPAPSL